MFLQRKINRAVKWSRERKMREDGRDPEQEALEQTLDSQGKGSWKEENPLPSMEEIRQEEAKLGLTGKDMAALIISGLLTIVPVVIFLLLVICLVVFLFFRAR